MAISPIRLLRRWRAFNAEVREEVNYLIERYGDRALDHVQSELARPDLSNEARRRLRAAARRLRR